MCLPMCRYVQSLMDAKLLNIDTEPLSPQSVISLNLKYSNKRTKFRIAGTVQKETPQEIEARRKELVGIGSGHRLGTNKAKYVDDVRGPAIQG